MSLISFGIPRRVDVVVTVDPAFISLGNRVLDYLDQTEQIKALTALVASKTKAVKTALEGVGVSPP